ncbi:DUF3967 domain-containing protein [Niallia sp. FSL K6-0077]|uniref:DUF3967 domain-containing protein n=1 Tax=Niallia sp. FSL K6-0077 TaxID=2954743 RepID=UPI0030FA7DFD
MSEIIDIPINNTEVATQLGIATSSLRKWCLALENKGYTFEKADRDKRLFYGDDVIVLQFFKDLVTNRNMSMNNAATIIANRFSKENNRVFFNGTEVNQVDKSAFYGETESNQNKNENELMVSQSELLNILRTHQEQMMITLKEQLKNELLSDLKEELAKAQVENNDQLLNSIKDVLHNQNEQINSNLNKRDKYLVESLRETIEAKKQIAATEEEKTKKKWYQFFK